MDKPADLKELINSSLESEIINHLVSVIPPSDISDNERFYLISNINRQHRGGNIILRIEEGKKLFYFGPAQLSQGIVKLIHGLRAYGYQAGNKPGGH